MHVYERLAVTVPALRMRRASKAPSFTIGDTMAFAECHDEEATFSVASETGFTGVLSLAPSTPASSNCTVKEELVQVEKATVRVAKDNVCDPFAAHVVSFFFFFFFFFFCFFFCFSRASNLEFPNGIKCQSNLIVVDTSFNLYHKQRHITVVLHASLNENRSIEVNVIVVIP